MADPITIPNGIQTKADFDQWLDHDVGDKLTKTQRDALKTDISAKLGLDMGNAITAFGRQEINKDVQYFQNNPTATSIPKLDPDPKVGDAGGPNHFNELWARSNAFSDPFLIDLSAVLALMHETSEKLRSATKELREVENLNQQAQMQAAAEDIKSQGMFQAISGAVGAGMSIASGAAGMTGATKGMAASKELYTDVKQLRTEFDVKSPTKDGLSLDPPSPKPLGDQSQSPKVTNPKTDGTTKSDDVTSTVSTKKKTSALDKENLRGELQDLKKQLEAGELKHDEYKVKVNTLIEQHSNNKFQTEIQMKNQWWQSYGTMIDGVGKAMSSSFQGVATGYEAEKAIKDKEAAQAGHEKEQTTDLIKTLADFAQQIRQTVASMIQSEDQAAQRVANV